MPTNDKSGRFQGLHTQVFELLKVVITLVLTGLIGGGITYYYQDRAQRDQQESKDLETARNSALTFLREVGDILEQRRGTAFRCLYAIRDNAPPDQVEQAWQDYMKAVETWNQKWNLYRALVLEEFGPEVQKRFYDEKADAESVWEKCSITGKLIIFHNLLVDYHNQNRERPPQDPKKIEELYSSVAQDCYSFYSEVISRIQESKVGKRSWATTPPKA
jgi:hypothetical protein